MNYFHLMIGAIIGNVLGIYIGLNITGDWQLFKKMVFQKLNRKTEDA